MSNTMFDAREVLIPGSVYDRLNGKPGGPKGFTPNFSTGMNIREPLVRPHDQLSYIASERTFANALNLPVPVSMFMPQIPTHFSNQQQQQQQAGLANAANRGSNVRKNRPSRQKPPRYSTTQQNLAQQNVAQSSQSQASQEISQPFSQGPLTQGQLSMSQPFQMSQPGLSGLSQPELSQDSFLGDDFKSQADGLLSQDSTYQGDRMFYASQLSQGPFH